MIHALPLALALIAQAKPESPTPLDLVSAIETVVADAVEKTEQSVVAIARVRAAKGDETTAIRGREAATPLAGEPAFGLNGLQAFQNDYVSMDYGSGVVIGDNGEILTAFHVVKGASSLMVRAFGRQQFEAEVIAADPRSDLAVIAPRIAQGIQPPKLKAIKIGSSTGLRKGNFLLALGNPYNAARDGRASASWGILANIARRLEPSDSNKQLRHYPTLLQLDAKLNLGMSGGAVVNMRGELVGLTTNAVNASGFDAQAGYAVPIDAIGKRIIDTLRQGKEVEYGFLGIGLAEDYSNRVGRLSPNTPASDAGLVVGDQIVAVGDLKVIDSDSLVSSVNAYAPGEPIHLKIVRNGEALEKTIMLSKFPITGEVIATNRPAPWRGLRVDYLSMLPDGNLGRELLDAMSRGGVGVTQVIPGSAADNAGLRVGQVILLVNDKGVRTPAEFLKAVANAQGPVELGIEGDRKIRIEEK